MHSPNDFLANKSAINKYIVPLMVLVHIVIFSICVTSKGFATQSFVHVFIGLLFSCVATVTTILYAKSNVPKFVAVFLVATCTVKLPLCLIIPEQTFLSLIPLEGTQLSQLISERYFFYSLGLLGFSAGAIFVSRFFWNLSDPAKRDMRISLPEKGFIAILMFYLSLQSMRAVLLLVMHIGAPSVVTRELFIPKLAGVLNILGTRGLLLVTSGLLAWALSRRSYSALAIAMTAAVTYAFVELAGGWRSGMYYYMLVGAWIFLAAEPSKLKNRLKPFAIGFVILALLLFIPVMDYRNRLRQGMTPGQAFQAVIALRQDADQGGIVDKFHRITRRFNGLDLYIVASYGSNDQAMGFMSLINGSASRFFTHGLLGVPEEAVSTSGMTYWGSMSIAIGDKWLWFGGLMLGAFTGGFPMITRHWFYSPTMRTLYEANITITLLHLTMGNGAFLLYSKELLISFFVCIMFRFLATTQQSSAYYVPTQAQYPNS